MRSPWTASCRTLAAFLAFASALSASDSAFLIPEARCGQEECAWFALLIERDGAPVVPNALPPERLLPNGECYVRAAEKLQAPAGELRLTARYGRRRTPPRSLTLAPGEEKKTLFTFALPRLAATAREIAYFPDAVEFPPVFVARAEQCEFARVPADARAFDPARPALEEGGVLVVAPGTRLAAFAPAYFAALAKGGLPLVFAVNTPRVTPRGWDVLPAARRALVAGVADRLPEVVAGSAGVTEGPALVLAVDRAPAAGRTLRIDAKKTVRVHASAWDACGVARIELREGARTVLAADATTPQLVLQLEGDVVLSAATFLIAYARSVDGAEALSGVLRVAGPEKTPLGGAAPLCRWTSPQRALGIQFRVTAARDTTDTLFARAREGARVAPPELPFVVRKGDAPTLEFTLALPDRREFPAQVPVTLALSSGAVLWDGTIVVAPWNLDVFRPEGVPTLVRQEGRIGFRLGPLTLRALTTLSAPRALVLEVFGEGWNDASVAITVRGMPPRQPLALSAPIPARRGWHTLQLDAAGYRIAEGVALTIEARAPGAVLLGAVRALE